jgi:crotonobetainyl-CoA:carnitine CoA-transferase CaiB-like acyl-CoA transferase
VATATKELIDELESAMGPFLLTLTREEFFKGMVARKMLGYPVATVEDIRKDEQLAAREFWQRVDTPWGGEPIAFPGSFVLFDGARPAIRRTAPTLGEHNVEVYAELGLTPDELIALRGAGAI